MREVSNYMASGAVAALILATPCLAREPPPSGDNPPQQKPSPDPGGLNIQFPRPRLLAMASLASGNEYRDRRFSDRNTASFSGGIAVVGLSVSGWRSSELTTSQDAYEVLLGYSRKLPYVDLHAGYVVCGNDRMLGGCPDAARITLTSNAIAHTTLEASLDRAVSSNRHTLSASFTRDLWRKGDTSGAVRAGWTRTNYAGSADLEGASLRLIAAQQLRDGLEINVAAGAVWTSGRARTPGSDDGVFATTSLAWRY